MKVRDRPHAVPALAQTLSNHPLASHAPSLLPSHAQATNRAGTPLEIVLTSYTKSIKFLEILI